MSVDERRAMIVSSAMPLYIEHGASVTSRQLAEHLGIAEGTIFRAFGDKEALVRGVVDAFFDQTYQNLAPELDAPGVGLEEKLHVLIRHARERAKGVFTMLSLLDPSEAREYMKHRRQGQIEDAAAAAFLTHASEMNIAPDRIGSFIRLLVVAASAPRMDGGEVLNDDELVHFALYGLVGQPPRVDTIETVDTVGVAQRKD